jgi:hypothetical protein
MMAGRSQLQLGHSALGYTESPDIAGHMWRAKHPY